MFEQLSDSFSFIDHNILETCLKTQLKHIFIYMDTEEGKKEFSDIRIQEPTEDDWLIVYGLTSMLDPFINATKMISAEKYPTLLLVLPVLNKIKKV